MKANTPTIQRHDPRAKSSPEALRPGAPPAVWSAFVRQGQWKSWALAASFALNFLLAIAAIGFANQPPDVVLVDDSGRGTFVSTRVASDALVAFLQEQRSVPSDATVVHFTRDTLASLLQLSSDTAAESFEDALSLMTPVLRARIQDEARRHKLVERARAAGIVSRVVFEDLQLIERTSKALHVRARVRRESTPRGAAPGTVARTERLVVDVIHAIVPRTLQTPDGLLLADYRSAPVNEAAAADAAETADTAEAPTTP